MQAVTVLSYRVSEVCSVCQPGFLLTGSLNVMVP
jgi:hypothetical protein